MRELNKEAEIIADKGNPMRFYNYSYLKDILEKKHNVHVSLPTIRHFLLLLARSHSPDLLDPVEQKAAFGVAAVYFPFHTVRTAESPYFSVSYEAVPDTIWLPNGTKETRGKSNTYEFSAYLI